MNIMNNQAKRIQLVNEVGTMNRAKQNNLVDQGLAHEGAYQVDEV